MAGDPLADDAPLFIVPRVLDALRAYRARPKFGGDPAAPQLSAALDELLDALLAGLEAHPTRFWVMQQLRKTLGRVTETGAREQLVRELEVLMGILGIRVDALPRWEQSQRQHSPTRQFGNSAIRQCVAAFPQVNTICTHVSVVLLQFS